MKISGHEFKDFYDNGWPGDNWYHDYDDDASIFFDNEGELIDLDRVYDSDDLGTIVWQGPEIDDPTHSEGMSIAAAIKKWRKQKTTFSFVVSGPKENGDALRKELIARGFRVSK